MNVNIHQSTINLVMNKGLKIVDSIKFVGAHTISTDDPEKEYRLNFEKAKEKTENYLQMMENRYISSIGASIIYNSKVLSKFTHLSYNFHPPNDELEYFNNRARDFARSCAGGRYLVKKPRYFIPHELAGMGLHNFDNFHIPVHSNELEVFI